MKIYLDSCIVIYLVESHQQFVGEIIAELQKYLLTSFFIRQWFVWSV